MLGALMVVAVPNSDQDRLDRTWKSLGPMPEAGIRHRQDQKLMFYEQRFGDHGSSTARPEQAGDRYEKVDEKYAEITHH